MKIKKLFAQRQKAKKDELLQKNSTTLPSKKKIQMESEFAQVLFYIGNEQYNLARRSASTTRFLPTSLGDGHGELDELE